MLAERREGEGYWKSGGREEEGQEWAAQKQDREGLCAALVHSCRTPPDATTTTAAN